MFKSVSLKALVAYLVYLPTYMKNAHFPYIIYIKYFISFIFIFLPLYLKYPLRIVFTKYS